MEKIFDNTNTAEPQIFMENCSEALLEINKILKQLSDSSNNELFIENEKFKMNKMIIANFKNILKGAHKYLVNSANFGDENLQNFSQSFELYENWVKNSHYIENQIKDIYSTIDDSYSKNSSKLQNQDIIKQMSSSISHIEKSIKEKEKSINDLEKTIAKKEIEVSKLESQVHIIPIKFLSYTHLPETIFNNHIIIYAPYNGKLRVIKISLIQQNKYIASVVNLSKDLQYDYGFCAFPNDSLFLIGGKVKPSFFWPGQEINEYSVLNMNGLIFKDNSIEYTLSDLGQGVFYNNHAYFFGMTSLQARKNLAIKINSTDFSLTNMCFIPEAINNSSTALVDREILISSPVTENIFLYNIDNDIYSIKGKIKTNDPKLIFSIRKKVFFISNGNIYRLKMKSGVFENLNLPVTCSSYKLASYPVNYGKYFFFALLDGAIYRFNYISLRIKKLSI
ncbi:hypothetical protein SteCoe_13514 [Stentor coeruleus]|uniref:Uncharacterized protein n=1 Tax=Stentor coeruleus TaxID=5963 RepID=A0A1R2C886_9CILI|nr:hypothetical protein SteCoe_13514 [Stentor coeruleus]